MCYEYVPVFYDDGNNNMMYSFFVYSLYIIPIKTSLFLKLENSAQFYKHDKPIVTRVPSCKTKNYTRNLLQQIFAKKLTIFLLKSGFQDL